MTNTDLAPLNAEELDDLDALALEPDCLCVECDGQQFHTTVARERLRRLVAMARRAVRLEVALQELLNMHGGPDSVESALFAAALAPAESSTDGQ